MDSAILCGGDNLSIIKPIAQLLGYILDILFKGLNAIGIGNIAIAIIIFTLLVKMLMLPLQIKQQKMTKLQSVMNPEIKAIQEKYKGKNSDTVAMQKMQAETKAVYEKYGVSQWGSCVQLLIQMPILFALYRVFQQIPLYISQIKVLFLNILGLNGADGISSVIFFFVFHTFLILVLFLCLSKSFFDFQRMLFNPDGHTDFFSEFF